MKSLVLHIAWCNISDEAEGEIWNSTRLVQETQSLLSVHTSTLWTQKNGLCTRNDFISTRATVRDHGDKRWQTEVTSNTYFRLTKYKIAKTKQSGLIYQSYLCLWEGSVLRNTVGALLRKIKWSRTTLLQSRCSKFRLFYQRRQRLQGRRNQETTEKWAASKPLALA